MEELSTIIPCWSIVVAIDLIVICVFVKIANKNNKL
jgi:hypothetical protein